MIYRARFLRAADGVGVIQRCDHEDRNVTRAWKAMQLGAGVEAIHVGHQAIQDHQIWADLLTKGERLNAVPNFDDTIAVHSQDLVSSKLGTALRRSPKRRPQLR